MGMPASQRRQWTRAEVVALIADNPLHTPRYELVDGELLVTPSPSATHQRAVGELYAALLTYLRRPGAGIAYVSPFDVELERGTMTQPDIFVVPREESKRLVTEMPARVLLLAVEVVSPGSVRHDRGRKRALYQRNIPEYWVVDIDSRLVERWRAGDERPEILSEMLTWQPVEVESAFTLELGGFFATVLGEAE